MSPGQKHQGYLCWSICVYVSRKRQITVTNLVVFQFLLLQILSSVDCHRCHWLYKTLSIKYCTEKVVKRRPWKIVRFLRWLPEGVTAILKFTQWTLPKNMCLLKTSFTVVIFDISIKVKWQYTTELILTILTEKAFIVPPNELTNCSSC